jgi:hypothetical protein
MAGEDDEIAVPFRRGPANLAGCLAAADLNRLNRTHVDAALRGELRQLFIRRMAQPGLTLRDVRVSPLWQHWWFDDMEQMKSRMKLPGHCASECQTALRCAGSGLCSPLP